MPVSDAETLLAAYPPGEGNNARRRPVTFSLDLQQTDLPEPDLPEPDLPQPDLPFRRQYLRKHHGPVGVAEAGSEGVIRAQLEVAEELVLAVAR
jgi:hypothetical protein